MHLSQRFLAVAAALALSLSLAASAQPGRVPVLIPEAILGKLGLSPDQAGKVQAAANAFDEEVARSRALGTQREKRRAVDAARVKYDAAVAAVLTAEQRARLSLLQEETKQFRTLGPVGGRLVGLNLTAEQKAKARAVVDRHQPEMDRLRASAKGAPDPAAVLAQRRALNAKIAAEVRAVLTPEQQKGFDGAKQTGN